MTRSEAENGIRHLSTKWARQEGLNSGKFAEAYFGDFLVWLRTNHPEYLEFRSEYGTRTEAELWFEDEMGR